MPNTSRNHTSSRSPSISLHTSTTTATSQSAKRSIPSSSGTETSALKKPRTTTTSSSSSSSSNASLGNVLPLASPSLPNLSSSSFSITTSSTMGTASIPSSSPETPNASQHMYMLSMQLLRDVKRAYQADRMALVKEQCSEVLRLTRCTLYDIKVRIAVLKALDNIQKEFSQYQNAQMLYELGTAQYNLGQYADAIVSSQTALSILTNGPDKNSLQHANTLHLLGVAQHECSQYSDAVASYQEALNIITNGPAINSLTHANKLVDLGKAQNALGQHPAAITSYQAALSIFSSGSSKNNNQHKLTLDYLANAQYLSGQYAAAITGYQTVLSIITSDPSKNSVQHAVSLVDLGRAQYAYGQCLGAINSFQAAVKIFEHCQKGTNHHIQTLCRLGICYLYSDQSEKTPALVELAKTMYMQLSEKPHITSAWLMRLTGELLQQQSKDGWDSMKLAVEEAEKFAQAWPLHNFFFLGEIYLAKAKMSRSRHNYSDALAEAKQALAQFNKLPLQQDNPWFMTVNALIADCEKICATQPPSLPSFASSSSSSLLPSPRAETISRENLNASSSLLL